MASACGSSNINWNFEAYQLCDQTSHSATHCPWLYTKCMKPGCIGIRMILVSESNIGKGKKFLKCQFPTCDEIEWLTGALKGGKYAKSLKCYLCNDTDHPGKDCPWDGVPCQDPGCIGSRYVLTAGTAGNKGKKFLSCEKCNSFEWLVYAIAKHEAATKQEMMIRKNPNTRGKATMDVVCHDFEKKVKIQTTIPKCFHCEGTEHMSKDCPWKANPCINGRCDGTTYLGTSTRPHSKERKYLKCQTCGVFAWLTGVLGGAYIHM